LFFRGFKAGEKKQKKKAVTDSAPYWNRQTQENGIRTLRYRITIDGLGQGAEALIGNICIYPIMGQCQVYGIGKA